MNLKISKNLRIALPFLVHIMTLRLFRDSKSLRFPDRNWFKCWKITDQIPNLRRIKLNHLKRKNENPFSWVLATFNQIPLHITLIINRNTRNPFIKILIATKFGRFCGCRLTTRTFTSPRKKWKFLLSKTLDYNYPCTYFICSCCHKCFFFEKSRLVIYILLHVWGIQCFCLSPNFLQNFVPQSSN